MLHIYARARSILFVLAGLLAAAPLRAAETPADPFQAAVEKLKNDNPMVRRQGTEDLARLRDPRAAAILLKTLSDDHPYVRSAAVDAVGRLRASEAAPRLVELLAKDKDAQVRQQAAISLAHIGDKTAAKALLKALDDEAPGVRFAAARALGVLRAPEAVGPLAERLKDPAEGMRRAAASALGVLSTPEALPPLREALQDKDLYVRREAARGLAAGETSTEALKTALEDPDGIVRAHAAMGLGRLGDPAGEAAAVALLSHADHAARQQAGNVLGFIGTKDKALPALQKALAAEKHPATQAALKVSLAQLMARLGVQEAAPAPAPRKAAPKKR